MIVNSTILDPLEAAWRQNWKHAKAVWSPFIKLQEPIWCRYTADAIKAGLTGSFAAIRLSDHRIVIDLEGAVRSSVQDYSLQILAHEIGHHIYAPANLRDHALLLGRIRWALADIEDRAAFVSNIYTDLLINDKLQRIMQLDMAAVYKGINQDIEYSELWVLIMRSYEFLWKLKRGTLSEKNKFQTEKLNADASLIASLIRSYSKNWMEGGGRFAALLYPYLADEAQFKKQRAAMLPVLDAEQAGEGGGMISGLTAIDPEAIAGSVDPREEAIKGKLNGSELPENQPGGGINTQGGEGPKQRYLNPGVYMDLQKQVNPNISEQELLNNYYREIALPYLINFPQDENRQNSLTLPEGMDTWEVGDPVEEIDWLESLVVSPQIFPGFNTRKRVYGPDTEDATSRAPLDVYIGVDCSGSMGNPAVTFSWPVLAATIIALSALRAGAKVMGCLSGEPGSYMETKGFTGDERHLLSVLTSYLGTGYAFGVPRLKEPFTDNHHQSHIVIVTDDDIFSMLSAAVPENVDNWSIIERALKNAAGIGTIVLHSFPQWHREEVRRLQQMGWRIFYVSNEMELIEFARGFSEANYQNVVK